MIEQLDMRAEVDARLTDEICDVGEGPIRILAIVEHDDDRQSATDELVAAGVLGVAAVGEIPQSAARPAKPRQPFVDQIQLDRKETRQRAADVEAAARR